MVKRKRECENNENDICHDSQDTDSNFTVKCPYFPCINMAKQFNDYPTYEAHILGNHNYSCSRCHKVFPSEFFLDLHIDEIHNPLQQIQRENGVKTYKCFLYLQGCKKVCSTHHKRKLHMIDKHGYPRDFDFAIVHRGIK